MIRYFFAFVRHLIKKYSDNVAEYQYTEIFMFTIAG